MAIDAQKMRTVAPKLQLLKHAGFEYSFDRSIYLNRNARKVFSVEFVEDHSEEELEAGIRELSPKSGEWRFYFNSELSRSSQTRSGHNTC